MSKKLLRNVCFVGIARYVGETLSCNETKLLAEDVIRKSDIALEVLFRSTKTKKNLIELNKIQRKLERFFSQYREMEAIEAIALTIALIEDVIQELKRINDTKRKQALDDLLEALIKLHAYYDEDYVHSELYDNAINMINKMEEIWN